MGLRTQYINSYKLNKHEHAPLRFYHKLMIMKNLINGLKHLHSHGIAHRDLKPNNVLIGKPLWWFYHDFTNDVKNPNINYPSLDDYTIWITDLGTSGKIKPDGTELVTYKYRSLIFSDEYLSSCGTKGYMAPELLEECDKFIENKEIDFKSCDIFAMGIMFNEILKETVEIYFMRKIVDSRPSFFKLTDIINDLDFEGIKNDDNSINTINYFQKTLQYLIENMWCTDHTKRLQVDKVDTILNEIIEKLESCLYKL